MALAARVSEKSQELGNFRRVGQASLRARAHQRKNMVGVRGLRMLGTVADRDGGFRNAAPGRGRDALVSAKGPRRRRARDNGPARDVVERRTRRCAPIGHEANASAVPPARATVARARGPMADCEP